MSSSRSPATHRSPARARSRSPARARSRSPARGGDQEDDDPVTEDDELFGRPFFKNCVRILAREIREGVLSYKFKLYRVDEKSRWVPANRLLTSCKDFQTLELAYDKSIFEENERKELMEESQEEKDLVELGWVGDFTKTAIGQNLSRLQMPPRIVFQKDMILCTPIDGAYGSAPGALDLRGFTNMERAIVRGFSVFDRFLKDAGSKPRLCGEHMFQLRQLNKEQRSGKAGIRGHHPFDRPRFRPPGGSETHYDTGCAWPPRPP